MTETHRFFFLRSLDKSENPTDERQRTQARDTIIGERTAFVESLVQRVFPSLGLNRNNDYDDVIAEGYLALVSAVDSFDPEHGVPFDAYAVTHICHDLRDYANRRAALSNRRTKVGIEVCDVVDTLAITPDFSLDLITRTAIQTAVGVAIEKVEAALTTTRDKQSWARQKTALALRFGTCAEKSTFLAIGLTLGISPEAAEKVLNRAFDRLRPHLTTLLLGAE